jgi:hypothetical protein
MRVICRDCGAILNLQRDASADEVNHVIASHQSVNRKWLGLRKHRVDIEL